MFDKIKDILKFIFVPFVCSKSKDIKITDEKTNKEYIFISKSIYFETMLIIDILFYGYIYSVLLSWFGHIRPFLDYKWLFYFCCAFWSGMWIGDIIKIYVFKQKNI